MWEVLVNNNIATPECFDRYFALTLENDAIPTSVMKHIIYEASEGEFTAEMMRLYREGKIVRLLEEIEAYAATSQFFSLPKDDQMNAIAFILVTERTPSESVMKDCIAEDAIEKALNQLRENATNE